MVAGFQQALDRQMSVPLTTTAVALDSRNATVRGREAAIGNLIADAMRERTRADAAIMNGGGIRGGKVYAAGHARSPAATCRPNCRSATTWWRSTSRAAICGSRSRTACRGCPADAGRFPQVSGMTVEFDPRQPAGSRVLSITVGGAPLDADKTYRVAVNDFMARGGDGYRPSPRSIRWCRSKTRRCCPTR